VVIRKNPYPIIYLTFISQLNKAFLAFAIDRKIVGFIRRDFLDQCFSVGREKQTRIMTQLKEKTAMGRASVHPFSCQLSDAQKDSQSCDRINFVRFDKVK
jgi:hypothetical protein